MKKVAIIIYGSPGSGKGTQAELLAKKINAIHFDTGRYIERLINSEEAKTDEVLKKIKVYFDKGDLSPPDWVLRVTSEEAKKISKVGMSIIFSGSPRTVFEAFGDMESEEFSNMLEENPGEVKGLIETLTEEYGKENIFVIQLDVPEEASTERNKKRLVCSVCATPILAKSRSKKCSFCGGPSRTRSVDKPEVIKVRLKEYHGRTQPILNKLKKLDYDIINIDGTPAPYEVHQEILKQLHL